MEVRHHAKRQDCQIELYSQLVRDFYYEKCQQSGVKLNMITSAEILADEEFKRIEISNAENEVSPSNEFSQKIADDFGLVFSSGNLWITGSLALAYKKIKDDTRAECHVVQQQRRTDLVFSVFNTAFESNCSNLLTATRGTQLALSNKANLRKVFACISKCISSYGGIPSARLFLVEYAKFIEFQIAQHNVCKWSFPCYILTEAAGEKFIYDIGELSSTGIAILLNQSPSLVGDNSTGAAAQKNESSSQFLGQSFVLQMHYTLTDTFLKEVLKYFKKSLAKNDRRHRISSAAAGIGGGGKGMTQKGRFSVTNSSRVGWDALQQNSSLLCCFLGSSSKTTTFCI